MCEYVTKLLPLPLGPAGRWWVRRQGREREPDPQGCGLVPPLGAEEVLQGRRRQVHRKCGSVIRVMSLLLSPGSVVHTPPPPGPHLHDPSHPDHLQRPHLLQDPGTQWCVGRFDAEWGSAWEKRMLNHSATSPLNPPPLPLQPCTRRLRATPASPSASSTPTTSTCRSPSSSQRPVG